MDKPSLGTHQDVCHSMRTFLLENFSLNSITRELLDTASVNHLAQGIIKFWLNPISLIWGFGFLNYVRTSIQPRPKTVRAVLVIGVVPVYPSVLALFFGLLQKAFSRIFDDT